jgi:DNA-binding NarL/FixJ family response regulator
MKVSVRILLVDDSKPIRKLVRVELETHKDWEVCGEAENGQQAIEKAEQLKPDLIVLDLSMPVMNGLQAAPALKKLLPATLIVMFTSFKTDHLHEQALKGGIAVVIDKSNPLAVLVSTIESLLLKQSNKLRNLIA